MIDLVEVQLVYSTSFYKSLATGGNVSKALVRSKDSIQSCPEISLNSELAECGSHSVKKKKRN